jgi:nicotinate phosphoribosyltransferase
MPANGLLTDHYELTMLQAALRSGAARAGCVFEVFARSLPTGRRYGVVAGTGRFLDELADFRFDPAEIAFLRQQQVVDSATLDWLADYRFRGDIDGHAEGEAYFPGSPILQVRGTFAECVLLETLVLSVLNHDTAIASAAARMVVAAGGRPLLEMGSRRTHEIAAIAAARAAYIAGFAATSNLAAGALYGIPTLGTSAHAFTLVHPDERAAFRAQVDALGTGTTLLVDTYDVPTGVLTAIEVAGPELGAVRLDSGDLVVLATEVRAQLDALGATGTNIVVTSDLDEYAIAALAAAPIDTYGVGTSLVIGSGAPTARLVYKLVERDGIPVAKTAAGKHDLAGRKRISRELHDGVAVADVVHADGARAEGAVAGPARSTRARSLHVPLVRGGDRVDDPSLDAARERTALSLAELPREALQLSQGEPAVPTRIEPWREST